MTRIVFRDFDEFADALGGAVGRFVPTARSTGEWWVQSVATGRLLTQPFQVGSPATFAGDGKRDEIALHIPLTDPTRIRIDGQVLDQNSFLLIKEGHPFTLSTAETTRWAAIVVPSSHELLALAFMESLTSRLFHTRTTSHANTKAEHLDRIRFLTARLSAAVGSVSFDATAVRVAEEELITLVSATLEASRKAPSRHVGGRPSFSRSRIIAKTLSLIEASTGEPLLMDDLCRATGVAERTLRNIFREYFGVGPMRLLKLRQLREIRAELLAADPTHAMVSRIAARFGVWDLSLFSRNYKALFGESPSYTLRTASTRAQRNFGVRDTWLHYATRTFSSELTG